ncbi:hypothetical protein [Thioclava sp. DLFJ4-1]|uniref:hypothetical protein n=1 Tax=Thioclava sp. DLFJ4-1 TaxID=1915313 RepID=UPI00117BFA79|nr:hypothetical protein [Thioclava sp. DLFJ4-1]
MTHPKGLRLANETYAREGYPDRLYIPLNALSQWHRKWPCLPAFEPVCVGDPCEVYVRVQKEDELDTLRAENDRLREALQLYANGCDATETHACGYEGNLCCMTARRALKGGAA